ETPRPFRPAPARELLKYLSGKQLKAYRAYLDKGSYRAAAVFLQGEYPDEGWTEKNVRAYCSHAHNTLRRKAAAGEIDRKDYAAWLWLLAGTGATASSASSSRAEHRPTTRVLGEREKDEDDDACGELWAGSWALDNETAGSPKLRARARG